MCISIYLALIALFIYFSNFVINQYALSIASGENSWMLVSIGWEIVPQIWPVVILAMIISSALTLFITFKVQALRSAKRNK